MYDIKKLKQNIDKLKKLDEASWDKICKNCGLCCMTKVEDDDDKIYYSNYACPHFDIKSKKCKCYDCRLKNDSCQKITLEHILAGRSMPDSCAYVEHVFGPAKFPADIDWSSTKNISDLDFDDMELITTDLIPTSFLWSARYNLGNEIFPNYESVIAELSEHIKK